MLKNLGSPPLATKTRCVLSTTASLSLYFFLLLMLSARITNKVIRPVIASPSTRKDRNDAEKYIHIITNNSLSIPYVPTTFFPV